MSSQIAKTARKVDEGALVSSSDGRSPTSKKGERLTIPEEINLLQGTCPDCEQRRLVKGPLGEPNALQNYTCRACDSQFHDMGSYGVERLTNAMPIFERPER